jgi:hypothetical protein
MWVSASRWVRRRSRRPELALLLFLLACTGLLACGGDEEAKQLLGRIDRMRDAPIGERGPHIKRLAEITPKQPNAATAQRVCLEAYEKLQSAHDQIEASATRIAEMKAEGRKPRYEEIADADRATTMMREAQQAQPACTTAVAELRRSLR